MLKKVELSQILTLFSSGGTQELSIPFMCEKCGKCCREVSVRCVPADVLKYLNITEEGFSARYGGKTWRPCPFLLQSNLCSIYPVRPSPCRSFPLYTDNGDMGIGCPGKKLTQKIISILGRGVPYIVSEQGDGIGARKSFKERALQKLTKAQLSTELLAAFVRLNGL